MFSSRRNGTWIRIVRPVALAIVILAGATVRADEPKAIVLFDGRDLDGWKKTDFSRPGEVKVEDDAITMGVGSPMTGITTTRTDLPRVNYELSYEARRMNGTDFFAAATFPVGDSFATFVNGGWGGSVTGISSLDGADASENSTGTYFKYENSKWYRFRVRVTDTTIVCWVDDKKLVDASYKDHEVKTRIEVNANKPLGFATWEAVGAVRKIEVRKLTPEEAAEAAKPEE